MNISLGIFAMVFLYVGHYLLDELTWTFFRRTGDGATGSEIKSASWEMSTGLFLGVYTT